MTTITMKYMKNKNRDKGDFHKWISNYTGNIDYDNLRYVYNMFDLTKYKISKNNLIENVRDNIKMEDFLYQYGFVFV